MNKHFLEKNQVVAAIIPVDLQSAANNGDWVSLKGYGRVAAILYKAAGTAGDDPVFTLRQATDVSGTGAKALNFTRIDSKVGTQTGIGQFTTTTQAAANTYTDAVSAEAQAIMVVDIKAEDLDIDNGFDCVQLQIPDVGSNAQLGCALYVLHEPRNAKAVLDSAIVD
ncbi:hypothetical protein [uncultured Reyranella sp.]|jgi:hypothetical protein|uniref:hypothetical protein n=1 Tax=uncultured Reyranella sp. TaxID=735512 RepID=UPI00259CD9F8|nr:hypothetical protein [uncultured Reyranella sp.]